MRRLQARAVQVEVVGEEGRQDLTPWVPLQRGVSITDACLGWGRTQAVLKQLAGNVPQRRAKAS